MTFIIKSLLILMVDAICSFFNSKATTDGGRWHTMVLIVNPPSYTQRPCVVLSPFNSLSFTHMPDSYAGRHPALMRPDAGRNEFTFRFPAQFN